MPIELWKFPVPPTALVKGPNLAMLPQRCCEISFQVVEGENDQMLRISLVLEAVDAFKVTHLSALDAALINAAYGKLVDLGESSWLGEVSKRSNAYFAKVRKTPSPLEHLAICFDDGPCFEFICAGFTVRENRDSTP